MSVEVQKITNTKAQRNNTMGHKKDWVYHKGIRQALALIKFKEEREKAQPV